MSSSNNKSHKNWSGPWTKQKLDAFMNYLNAYLTIMKKYPKFKTIYFDGFAGSGEIIKEKSKSMYQFQMDFDIAKEDIEGIDVYKGSVSQVLQLSSKYFDYYYFIEKDEEKVKKINEIKQKATHLNKVCIEARVDDCNNQLPKLAEALNEKNFAALIFLDPFGMQINWKSIATLKDTHSDIWILIPSGVAVNRLLPKKGNIKSKNKLEAFFGMPIEEIKKIIYRENNVSTLFGSKMAYSKREKSIQNIVSLYVRQLKTIWKYVTENPLVLKNSKNSPIFHLLFASNNIKGLKIASQIIEKKQK